MAIDLKGIKLTWLGHATFLIESDGKNILIDPWVMGNPMCPEERKKLPKIDLILCTHGHFDHIGDAVQIAKEHGCLVVGIYELCAWMQKKGVEQIAPMNKGGTQKLQQFGVEVTMVTANHSCGIQDGDQLIYGGEACGFVLTFVSGLKLYHSGDTNVFGDMNIIRELYQPEIALLPIGDHFTMGLKEVVYAAGLLKPKQIIPMHFGTFPALTGTPNELRALLPQGVELVELKPGETIG
jgi:L-ascorbate metabolism protein UlaG (beta-lactamase superfamily)